jgi:hypothetical protein
VYRCFEHPRQLTASQRLWQVSGEILLDHARVEDQRTRPPGEVLLAHATGPQPFEEGSRELGTAVERHSFGRETQRGLNVRLEHWLYKIPRRLRSIFRRARVEQELDEELLVSAPALLTLVAVASCIAPAWRAAGVDPVHALRSE